MGGKSTKEISKGVYVKYYSNGDQYIGEMKDNKREGKGTFIYHNGDRYEGEWANNLKEGKGTSYYNTGELYIGDWVNHVKQGFGKYFYAKGERYIGYWKNNMKDGEGTLFYADSSYYKGNFKEGKRHGKGLLYTSDGKIFEEEWEDGGRISKKEALDAAKSPIIDNVRPNVENVADNLTSDDDDIEKKNTNGKSEEEPKKEMVESMDVNSQSEFDEEFTLQKEEEGKSFEMESGEISGNSNLQIDLETVSLIDQIEILSSIDINLLNKNIKDWTIEDVAMWLTKIGLDEYVEFFKKNHINGKNVLDLEEKDLKEDLSMSSVGHRKIFMKAINHLRKIFLKSKVFNSSLRNKMMKFYQQQKSKLRKTLKSDRFKEFSSKNFNSIGITEVIEEDENEFSMSESHSQKIHSQSEAEEEKKFFTEQIDQVEDKKFASIVSEDTLINDNAKVKPKKESVPSLEEKKDLALDKPHEENMYNPGSNEDSESSNTSSSSSSSEDQSKVLKEEEVKESFLPKEDENSGESPTLKKNISKAKSVKKSLQKPKRKKILNSYTVVKYMREMGISTNFLIKFKEIEIMQKIGEGGYGEVYYGKWLGQDVAIKEYGKNYKKFHKKRIKDFIKEVEVISNLRHPNIVLYMGICIEESRYLMITEYLEGGSLFDMLHKKNIKLDEERIILLAEDIALGMNYLHGRKVLHCDLKSSNILVDIFIKLDNNWNLKLCDFGLSRVKSKIDKKKNLGRVGTPHWMAPEILRGEKYDEACDIYSYGMILW